MSENELFEQLHELLTEQRNPSSMEIDRASTEEILCIINNEDKKVAYAVEKEIPFIAQAVDLIVDALKQGGRLIYAGAGTSGRLGALDAIECPPTFGTDPSMIQGIIAGGREAMFRAVEGAEDRSELAVQDIKAMDVDNRDVVCGIAASLRTPYVGVALKEAKSRGAKTIIITTNPRQKLFEPAFSELAKAIDVAICPEVGPEVIMGSTRMKSGTAQKLVLNMLTSAAMIRLGKVYENMMVDLQMTNEKLKERAKRILMIATGATYGQAAEALVQSSFHVKTALVMLKLGITREQAEERLKLSNGFVRMALNSETI